FDKQKFDDEMIATFSSSYFEEEIYNLQPDLLQQLASLIKILPTSFFPNQTRWIPFRMKQ
ncbi:hypothetical protein PTTG_30399, partial [Puccinia triticina 1-1 BBBD Race 1]